MPPRLEVICGPMFAGKTTLLIERVRAALAAGLAVAAFKPARDTRYAFAEIVTHAPSTGGAPPARLSARAIDDPRDLPRLAAQAGASVVAIDEAHFFGNALVAPVRALLADHARPVRIILAGVERDHTGAPFDPFPTLLVEADEVVKLHSLCARCGQPAIHSQRMIDAPPSARIVVGGAEAYQPRCRACFGQP